MANQSIDYVATVTGAKFHADTAFVRGILGPVGSGKSVACIMDMLSKAMQQVPHNGTRKTRFALIRNSYPELRTTTLQTFIDWLPMAKVNLQPPISARLTLPNIGDGTALDAEFLFLALDRPEDSKKLLSLELTGAFLNESRELPLQVLEVLTGRVGRYPSKRAGGATWSGILIDSNPPSTDSWMYRLFDEENLEGYSLHKQPGGLIREDSGEYIPNPLAENIENLPGGHEYYLRQIPGKQSNWIKSYVLGEYSDVMDGKPIYPQYNDDLHVGECKPINGLPVYIGLDFGLNPSATFVQLSPRGVLNILDELTVDGMGIKQFAESLMLPLLKTKYKDCAWEIFGDPAGVARSPTDEKTVFDELRLLGLLAHPTASNAPQARFEAVRYWLNRMTDGKPSFMLHPNCKMLRKGFLGGYRFKRLRVSGERYADKADKNEYSHIHDSLQYALQGLNADVRSEPVPDINVRTVADTVVGY